MAEEEHVRVRRRRGPNKDKRPLSRGDTPARAFAPGTPIDPKTQLPPGEEIEIDRATASRIPLDPESSRVAAEHHETMSRKARGESGVKWNADPRIRYAECAMLHPNARVSFRDISNDFDNFPSTYVSAARDYDALISYIEKNLWKGNRVTFKWTIGDDTQPQWATGLVKFDAKDPNMAQQQPPPGYGPNWGPPPPPAAGPQWGVPGYFNGQYWDGRQWAPYQAPPPPPPPPPPAPPAAASPPAPVPAAPAPPPAPVPAPVASTMFGGVDPQYQYLFDEIRRLHGELDRQRNQQLAVQPVQAQPQQAPPGWYNGLWWNGSAYTTPPPSQQQPQAQQAQPQPPPAPVAPVAQPTPLESAKAAVQTVLDLSSLNQQLEQKFGGAKEEIPEEVSEPKVDKPFPMQVQDFGAFRMAAIDEGEGPSRIVEGALPFAMLNFDKGAAAVKGLVSQIGEFMDQRIKQSTQVNNQQETSRRRAVEDAERLAAAQAQIAEAQEKSAKAEALKVAALQAQRALEQAPVAAPPPPPPAPTPVPVVPVAPAPILERSNGVEASPEIDEDEEIEEEIEDSHVSHLGEASEPGQNTNESAEPKAPVLSEN